MSCRDGEGKGKERTQLALGEFIKLPLALLKGNFALKLQTKIESKENSKSFVSYKLDQQNK